MIILEKVGEEHKTLKNNPTSRCIFYSRKAIFNIPRERKSILDTIPTQGSFVLIRERPTATRTCRVVG